jgi:SAM-dependent methyltransferase
MTTKYSQSELYSAFDTNPASVTEYLQWLVSTYGITSPCSVLDIGCGPGKMLMEFSRLQWPVIGLEPDQDYYEQAKTITKTHTNVIVIKGGFAENDFLNKFDLAVAINAPFAHLVTIEERVDALKKIYSSLTLGGIMFIDIANFSFILKNYRPPAETSITINGKKIKRIPEHSFDFHNNIWVHTDRFYEADNEKQQLVAEKAHRYAMLSLPEVVYFTKKAGFTDVRTYNSYASRESEVITKNRIMMSARKP